MSSGSSMRHLIRLAMLLALVLVLMRTTKQTSVFELFFGDHGRQDAVLMMPKSSFLAADTNTDDDAADRTDVGGPPDAGMSGGPEREDQSKSGPNSQVLASELLGHIGRVEDGVFSRNDSDAYYGLLDASSDQWRSVGAALGLAQDAPLVSVIPLLQQPDVYRGTMVRIEGQVKRIESIRPSDRPSHYRLWIRPRSGADRPIVVATMRLPDGLAAFVGQASVGEKVMVDLRGVFLKRLAYRSVAGAELAPLIIAGALASPQTNTPDDDAAPSRSGEGTLFGYRLGWGASIACIVVVTLLGILIAVWAMRSANASSDRLRQLRRSQPIDTSHLR